MARLKRQSSLGSTQRTGRERPVNKFHGFSTRRPARFMHRSALLRHHAMQKPQQIQHLQAPKKLRPALGGELAAREPVWDGEGWGCDRVAGSIIPYVLAVAGAGGGHRRPAVTERDPDIGIALRLPLDEAVAGLGPGQDVFVLVVEHE